MRTKIVCLGNEIVADDGIAIRVHRVLSVLPLPAHVTIELRASLGFELLDLIEGMDERDRLILVDATSTGRPPGTCTVTKPSDLNLGLPCAASCHLAGIGQVLEVAKHLFARPEGESATDRLDRSITIVGIEGACFDQYTTTLSSQVREALPNAVDAVLELIGADSDLLRLAKGACESWIARDPTIEETCGTP